MSPPSATEPAHEVPLEPGVTKSQARQEVINFPGPPTFEDKFEERKHLKGKLAAAFRIFGKRGYDEGVAGHITVRDPVEPDTFWVNPFGVAFSLINASDLIRVNGKGEVIDGGSCRLLNTAAYMIHHAVHEARPDVVCAAHSHTIHARAYSTLGKPLDITTQDACAFYNDHVVYDSFNGVVLADEEGKNIAKALGGKKAAILQNHGPLTVGKSVEEAVFWFIIFEKCCRAQLLADAAAAGKGIQTIKVTEEDAAYTHKTVGSSFAGWFSAKPEFDLIHKETGGDYLN